LPYSIITDPDRLVRLGWGPFIDAHPEGTIFQTPGMYQFFQEVPRFSPVVVAVLDETDRILGLLLGATIREMKGPGGYFSSRTVIYGGPLVEKRGRGEEGTRGKGEEGTRGKGEEGTRGKGEEGKILDLLLEELIRRVKNKSVFIQFRNFFSQGDNKELFSDRQFNYRDRLNLLLDTSSREKVIKNMSASRWRQIRKGLGAEIIKPENTGQVREFYDILHNLYRYKVKKPLPGWDFFERFYHLSGEGRLGIIRLVKFNDRIIGGILSPITPGKTIYEWYVCGLDQEYRELYPSVLATWAAIDYAIENNIPQFDFMGVGIPEREYGVRDFKMRFGGQMVNYGRFARVNNKMLYFAAETGYNLLALLKKI
jgi:hypothetical protein